MTFLSIVGGFIILLVGGDFLVRGSVSLARRLKISPLVIGLTVVALGTSSPELVISIDAILSDLPDIAIGNVVGSNIANILLVLGLPAIIVPIACNIEDTRRDGTVMLAVTIGFITLCLSGYLLRWYGIVMLFLLFGFLTWTYFLSLAKDKLPIDMASDEPANKESGPQTMWLSIALIILGIVGLMYGSNLLIEGATVLAIAMNVSEATIALTLIALGTSLPELATSLAAAIRRQGDVAIGNVIGSNLFNILGIMGIASLVTEIQIPGQIVSYDLWIMLASVVLVTPFVLLGRTISRRFGVLLTIVYLLYILSLYYGLSGMPN